MTLELELQVAVDCPGLPDEGAVHRWASATFAAAGHGRDAELVVRLVNAAESESLNATYRGKQGPTNVLAFAFEPPPGVNGVSLLGDVVICAPVVLAEAVTQHKPTEAHWAHMVVHGVLHLLGHDHGNDSDAGRMEALETRILQGLGYADPYGDPDRS